MSSIPVDQLPDASSSSAGTIREIHQDTWPQPRREYSSFVLLLADWTLLVLGAFLVLDFLTRAPATGLLHPAGFDLTRAVAFFREPYLLFFSLSSASIILAGDRYGLYRPVPLASVIDEGFLIGKSTLYGTLVLLALLYLVGSTRLSAPTIVAIAVANAVTLLVTRQFRSSVLLKRLASGRGLRNVIILGAGRTATKLATHLSRDFSSGYVVKGFLDHHRNGDPRVIGTFDDMPSVLRGEFIDEVFVTLPIDRGLVKRLAMEAAEYHVSVKVVPDFLEEVGWHAPLDYVGDFPVIAVHRECKPHIQLFLKRMIDIAGAVLGIVLCSPILIVTAILVAVDSGWPIFYRAERVGYKGHVFQCWKFRTMVSNAEQLLGTVLHLNKREQILFKIPDDPRLTRVGAFLRRYSLDELPQFFNVLVGNMSLVGPRPPTIREYEQYKLEHLRRLETMPGMTGLWQVSARSDPSFETYVRYDLQYIENWSLWLDFKIIAKTIPAVFLGTGC